MIIKGNKFVEKLEQDMSDMVQAHKKMTTEYFELLKKYSRVSKDNMSLRKSLDKTSKDSFYAGIEKGKEIMAGAVKAKIKSGELIYNKK